MFLGFYNYTVYLTYLNASIGLLGMFFLVLGKFDANGQFDANQFDPNYIKFASICILLSGICDMFDGKVSNFKKTFYTRQKIWYSNRFFSRYY